MKSILTRQDNHCLISYLCAAGSEGKLLSPFAAFVLFAQQFQHPTAGRIPILQIPTLFLPFTVTQNVTKLRPGQRL